MKVNNRKSKEAGQSILLMALALGLFLLGVVTFAVDMGNLWWHRQRAQSAADAACIAGAMDLLVYNQTPSPTQAQLDALGGNPKAGTSFTCSPTSKASACEYAALNSYNSAGVTAGNPGNKVTVSFPSSLPNATVPTVTVAVANPVWFMKVNVWDSVQTYFAGLLSGRRAQNVGAFATCGVVQASAPVPILVLKPTGSGTLSMNGGGGGGNIVIVGGPSQSIEVDSSDPAAACVFCGGGSTNASVDLTKAGPNTPPDGADFGTWGGPGTAPTFVKCGTGDPNCWKPNDPPITDPFAALAAPPKGNTPASIPTVPSGTNGCVEVSNGVGKGCSDYPAGYYPTGIKISGIAAIFEPGVYYIGDTDGKDTGLLVDSNSCVRPGTTNGDGSYGTVFYFANGATLNVQSGSQTKCVSTFSVTSGGLSGHGVFCPTLPAQLPTFPTTTISGNVFLGPCKSVGTNVYGGDKLFNDSTQRGMLFFQDHTANKSTDQPKLNGGGNYVAAGAIYFHATDYSDIFQLVGGSGSGSFAYGNIVTDQLTIGGNGGISMYLNAGLLTTGLLKATLIQ